MNPMHLHDAGDYFATEDEAREALKVELSPTEKLAGVEVRKYGREKDGTCRYMMNSRTHESIRGADVACDYYYIDATVHTEAINERYALTDMIPESKCRRAKGAMERHVEKRERRSRLKWRYAVMEIPEAQVDFGEGGEN